MRCPLVDSEAHQMEQCQWIGATQDDMTHHIALKHYQLLQRCSACGSQDEEHECSVKPKMLLNERIMVRWQCEDGGKWFEGLVTDYDPEEGTHLVKYEDKYDSLTLFLTDISHLFSFPPPIQIRCA